MIRVTTKYEVNGNVFDTYFTIFRPEFKEKSMIASLNTSRKCDPEYDRNLIENGIAKEYNGNYYVSSYWNAVFVGKAFNKAKKHEVEELTKITNVICDMTNEPYINSEGEKKYNNVKLRIYDFDFPEFDVKGGLDTPPKVANTSEEEDDEELPF